MALGTPLTEHLPSGDLLIAIEDLTGIPLHVLFCPHLDDCPLAKEGLIPRPDQPCCKCEIVPFPPPAAS